MKDNNSSIENDADPNSISIERAQSLIFDALPRITETEQIPVVNCKGRIVAEDIFSPIDVPPFRASAMDGYAYRHADSEKRLKISASSLAGHPSDDNANENECHRITTGARVPDFADTVVQQENVSVDNESIVTITKQPSLGHHVRPVGSNSKKGDLLLPKGQRLGAAQIASLYSQGMQSVRVLRTIKVAIFSTGDELADNGETLELGSIFDANRALLSNMLEDAAVEVHDMGIVEDSIDALNKTLDKCQFADMVISSGGVSVGDADFVRPVLQKLGQIQFWKIAVKPGRPLTFGRLQENVPYFGLPGNPVSAAVTSLLFVKPALKTMLSEKQITLPRVKARLSSSLTKLPGRVEFQRGIVKQEDGEWQVSTTGLQDSHVVTSLHIANCFIELGFDSHGANAGDEVSVIPFAHFGTELL